MPLSTPDTITRHIKKGHGQGEGKLYKPWLEPRHVSSLGKSTRVLGWKTGRQQSFLSQLELRYFYMLEWSESISDIREQFPLLPLDTTRRLCQESNVKHPTIPGTTSENVMTTDFLIFTKDGKQHARSIKPVRDLENPRTLEKLEIERLFWAEQETDFALITEEQLNLVVAKNVEWVHPKYLFANLAPLTAKDTVTTRSSTM